MYKFIKYTTVLKSGLENNFQQSKFWIFFRKSKTFEFQNLKLSFIFVETPFLVLESDNEIKQEFAADIENGASKWGCIEVDDFDKAEDTRNRIISFSTIERFHDFPLRHSLNKFPIFFEISITKSFKFYS